MRIENQNRKKEDPCFLQINVCIREATMPLFPKKVVLFQKMFKTDTIPILGSEYLPIPSTDADTSRPKNMH